MDERVTMWISRYALTQGLFVRTGAIDNGYFYFGAGGAFDVQMKVGKDAHSTKEQAAAAAESMRKSKLAALKRQMRKLRGLKF